MKTLTTLALLLFSAQAFALQPSNTLKFGNGTATGDKQLVFDTGSGSSNPKIKYSIANSKLQFSHDGTNFKDIGSGAGSGQGIQLLVNPDAESGSANWTNAGGGTFAIDSSTPLLGTKSFKWTASANTDNLTSEQETVPPILKGQGCAASMTYTGGSTALTLQVINASAIVLASQQLQPSGSIAKTVVLPFLCPSSGSIAFRLSASSSSALITFDQAFLGSASTAQISQASLVGTMSITGCTGLFTWVTGSYSDSTLSGCTYTGTGLLSAPSTQLPGFSAALPEGEYYVVATDEFSMSAGVEIAISFTNGTISTRDVTAYIVSSSAAGGNGFSDMHFNFSVPSGSSASDWRIQAKTLGGSGGLQANATGGDTLVFSVYRFPTQAQVVSQATGQAATWSGAIDAASAWTTTSTVQTDFTAATTPVLTQGAQSNLACVIYGTQPGVTCPVVAGHTYDISMSSIASSSSSGQAGIIYLTDGTTTIASQQTYAFLDQPISIRGHWKATSTGSANLWLQGKSSSGGSQFNYASGSDHIEISIVDITQPGPTLILPGNVQSSSSGQVLHESWANTSGTACSINGVCAMTWGTGGITSVVRAATGSYTANFSGFSVAPSCTIGGETSVIDYVDSTSMNFRTFPAGSASNSDWGIMTVNCTGPK